MLAKQNRAKIIYDNKDISSDLAPYLLSVSYSDQMSNKADDLTISLEDSAGLWCGDWMPEKGAMLTVSIISGKKELDLGQFEVDNPEMSGPPSVVKIKAVSVPNNTNLRGVDKSRAWEKVNLSVIAGDIANDSGMELFYDTETDPELSRAEQTEQSDLSFLQKLCDDAGLALKITDMQIVIFDEEKYEQADPIVTLTRGVNVKSYNFKTSTKEIYRACHVKYQDPKTSELIEATFKAPDKTEGKTLEINKQVESIAEAEELAKKELRNKNKGETTGSITIEGNINYLAGLTVMVEKFGWYDGKYIITKADHDLGSGYNTRLDLRKCLDGY